MFGTPFPFTMATALGNQTGPQPKENIMNAITRRILAAAVGLGLSASLVAGSTASPAAAARSPRELVTGTATPRVEFPTGWDAPVCVPTPSINLETATITANGAGPTTLYLFETTATFGPTCSDHPDVTLWVNGSGFLTKVANVTPGEGGAFTFGRYSDPVKHYGSGVGSTHKVCASIHDHSPGFGPDQSSAYSCRDITVVPQFWA
jgi:hypothetical protein